MSEQRWKKQDLTAVLEVLADEDRRDAVEYLALADGTVPLDDLVDYMVATAVSGDPHQSRKQTVVQFHHVHLPKLDAAGLIDYDPDEQLVEPTEKVAAAVQLLPQERENGPQ